MQDWLVPSNNRSGTLSSRQKRTFIRRPDRSLERSPKLGDLVAGRHPALHRIRGDVARQYHDVHRGEGT
jgi:hypothetical protein